VKGPTGTQAASPEESIGLLLDEHFPGSQKIEDITTSKKDPSFTKLEDLATNGL
jgi:hypothetical protein